MNLIIKVFASILIIGMMLILQACPVPTPPVITVISNDFDFKAINLTVDNGKLTANGGTPVIVNWTVNVTINGETTLLSGSSNSNELPVMVGNEIEIQFTPSCPEQTEAYFTMPDGSSHKATVDARSFKWTVPTNFTDGMEITGETRYETDDAEYKESGVIKLIALDK